MEIILQIFELAKFVKEAPNTSLGPRIDGSRTVLHVDKQDILTIPITALFLTRVRQIQLVTCPYDERGFSSLAGSLFELALYRPKDPGVVSDQRVDEPGM
jgi:hypothetical protein